MGAINFGYGDPPDNKPFGMLDIARDYLTRIITQIGPMKALTDALLQCSQGL